MTNEKFRQRETSELKTAKQTSPERQKRQRKTTRLKIDWRQNQRRQNRHWENRQWGDAQIFLTGGVPFYRQIARYLRRQVVAGAYLQGNRLPASRQLAMHLGVHYNTVLKAYRILRNQGLIRIGERVRGWFDRKRPHTWLIESVEDKIGYEIKASLRELLALGVPIGSVARGVGDLEKAVFSAARKNPQERQRRLYKKLRKKWPRFF